MLRIGFYCIFAIVFRQMETGKKLPKPKDKVY